LFIVAHFAFARRERKRVALALSELLLATSVLRPIKLRRLHQSASGKRFYTWYANISRIVGQIAAFGYFRPRFRRAVTFFAQTPLDFVVRTLGPSEKSGWAGARCGGARESTPETTVTLANSPRRSSPLVL